MTRLTVLDGTAKPIPGLLACPEDWPALPWLSA